MTATAPDPAAPAIAVAVAAGRRPLRLRWLLNALEAQGAAEVVVAVRRQVADAPWRSHPLVADGAVRTLDAMGCGEAGALDAAWRAARAPAVAFLDEDSRPPGGWLDRAERRATGEPGAVLVGGLGCDPLERALRFAPLAHVREVPAGDPLAPAAGTVWPRAALERLGGLDAGAPSSALAGADLLARARAAGVTVRAAPELAVHDAVRPWAWRELAADAQLAWLLRRRPELRRALALAAFRRASHAKLALAAGGIAASRRHPAAAALVLPWAAAAARGVPARAVPARLARRALRDGLETAALAAGSVRHGSLVL